MKKIHESENMSSVIQSPAMQAPPPNRMLAYHSDPIKKIRHKYTVVYGKKTMEVMQFHIME